MSKFESFSFVILSLTFRLDYVKSRTACDSQIDCYDQLGPQSWCAPNYVNGSGFCVCPEDQFIDPSENSTCQDCPGFGESCQVSQCCSGDYLICSEDICKCIYDDYCWTITNSERLQFQRIAQCVLAVALTLTAAVLFILFWNACKRRNAMERHIEHQMPADSFLSLNSIQRLVLMQLQDRPPPYSAEPAKPWKNLGEMTESPPSYVEAVGLPIFLEGIENQAFVSDTYTTTNTAQNENCNTTNFEVSNDSSILISCIFSDDALTAENSDTLQNNDTASGTSISPNSQTSEVYI